LVNFVPQKQKTLLEFTHSNLNPSSTHDCLVGWNQAMDKIVKMIIEEH